MKVILKKVVGWKVRVGSPVRYLHPREGGHALGYSRTLATLFPTKAAAKVALAQRDAAYNARFPRGTATFIKVLRRT